MKKQNIAFIGTILLVGTVFSHAAAPQVISPPAVNAERVLTDNTTQYTVTMTVADADGYDDLRDFRIIFNISQSGYDPSYGRGYLLWGKTDADITRYSGNFYLADATGGGRWGYMTDNWGGTTYITPLGASMSTSGSATGGTGSRTVSWTFTAKSAWAFNPLVNDPDFWYADYASDSGWLDSPNEFDVVGATCGQTSPTPSAPVVSEIGATSFIVAINPVDSDTLQYALRVEPEVAGLQYVQQDGSLGGSIAWQTKAQWGSTTVSGVNWLTEYTVQAKAYAGDGSTCPSDWGTGTSFTTQEVYLYADFAQETAFNEGVRGQNPYRMISTSQYPNLWQITEGSCGRGLAGGLDADTYDWRDIYSGSPWGQGGGRFTTLQFLRYARDYNAYPLITANAFGGGSIDPADNTFNCVYDNPEGLAADWVRYTNIILQNYRQGDEGSLSGEDLRVYNSISNWNGKDQLLAPGEAATPVIEYWEIGNEPELGGFTGFLKNHYLSPTGYRDRYKSIAQAMRAVDPTVKVGPCLMKPADTGGSGQWLDALADDSSAPIDFVSYHPYYYDIKNSWGNPTGVTQALRKLKAYLDDQTAGIHTIMQNHGRTGYGIMASEWNPLNWDATWQMQSSQSMALSVAEAVFTFAELDLTAAHFWEQAQSKLGARGAFIGLRDYMGDVLIANMNDMGLNPDSSNWRLYVTRDTAVPGRVVLWGLNFNEDEPIEITVGLSEQVYIQSATLMHYGQPGDDAAGGDTSLMDYSGMVWESIPVSAAINSLNIPMVLEDAEITLLILDTVAAPKPDFDRDGDVDQSDFGHLQACYSGANKPQTKTECQNAQLDTGSDVDLDDFNKFVNCISGENVPVDPNCMN